MTIPMGANFEAPSDPAAEPATVVTADEKGVEPGPARLPAVRLAQAGARSASCSSCCIVGFAISRDGIGSDPRLVAVRSTKQLLPIRRAAGMPTLTLWPFSLGDHPFGQNSVGKDYFAMVMRGSS